MEKLTANEIKILEGIESREFSFFDDGIEEDSNTWSSTLTYEGSRLLEISEQAMGGVISSLIQKGIFRTIFHPAEPWNDSPADTGLIITPEGAEILKSIREKVGA
jgi:hypothetical protein